jgi:hypothetical protein
MQPLDNNLTAPLRVAINMKILASALLIPSFALANEVSLSCNLERSKAEVQASTLSAPSAIGQIGQDATTGAKSLIVGISQSFSGRSQAGLLREAAEAKCDSIRATLQLDEHARWSQLQVAREGFKAELRIIEQAISLAKTNISFLDAQLAEKLITINEHTAARQSLVALESREAELLRSLSTTVLPPPEANVVKLLEASRRAEGMAASLTAKAAAERGWDVVVSAGGRQPQHGSATPYATIGFSYSFGSGDAQRAAQAVGEQTEALASAQQGGYTQTALRQQETLRNLIQAETLAAATSARQEEHLRRVRSSIIGINTALALNTLRSLDLQLKVLEADRVGAETRLDGYRHLLDQLK